ncbi:hypothetical protein V8E54_002602 [Elaphomyces granulatus]
MIHWHTRSTYQNEHVQNRGTVVWDTSDTRRFCNYTEKQTSGFRSGIRSSEFTMQHHDLVGLLAKGLPLKVEISREKAVELFKFRPETDKEDVQIRPDLLRRITSINIRTLTSQHGNYLENIILRLPDLLDINPWIMDYKEAIGTSDQILDCQWVIMNTTSKHGKLLRHKARPENLGNQQHDCGLPTRATALAMTLPRVLSAIVANFDLHTLQTDILVLMLWSTQISMSWYTSKKRWMKLSIKGKLCTLNL